MINGGKKEGKEDRESHPAASLLLLMLDQIFSTTK